MTTGRINQIPTLLINLCRNTRLTAVSFNVLLKRNPEEFLLFDWIIIRLSELVKHSHQSSVLNILRSNQLDIVTQAF